MSELASPPVGLLLGRDLIFQSKVVGTAAALGRTIHVAGSAERAAAILAEHAPRVVFVDLGAADLAAAAVLARLRAAAGPGAAFVAFGSHVDAGALAEARRAGCDPVMPRSKFTVDLPDLIRRHLDVDAAPEA